MVQNVRRMRIDTQRHRDTLTDMGVASWQSRWGAGDVCHMVIMVWKGGEMLEKFRDKQSFSD